MKVLKEPGHYVDGDGLALVIGRRGGKSWVLRTVVKGKRRGIGPAGVSWVSWVSLAEARDKARTLRLIAREGGDPIATRRVEQECPTFEEAARRVHTEQIADQGRNEKHRAQWLSTLPPIGPLRKRSSSGAQLLPLRSIWSIRQGASTRAPGSSSPRWSVQGGRPRAVFASRHGRGVPAPGARSQA